MSRYGHCEAEDILQSNKEWGCSRSKLHGAMSGPKVLSPSQVFPWPSHWLCLGGQPRRSGSHPVEPFSVHFPEFCFFLMCNCCSPCLETQWTHGGITTGESISLCFVASLKWLTEYWQVFQGVTNPIDRPLQASSQGYAFHLCERLFLGRHSAHRCAY